jgi:hypothetical protein
VSGAGIVISSSEGIDEGVAVRDITPDPSWNEGAGIVVMYGQEFQSFGALTLRGSLIERVSIAGAILASAVASIEGLAVRDVESDLVGEHGDGLSAQHDWGVNVPSNLVLRSSTVQDVQGLGVMIDRSTSRLESSVVRGAHQAAAGRGSGIQIYGCDTPGCSAAVTMRSVLIEDTHDAGVRAYNARVAIEGSIIRGSSSTASGLGGDGLAVIADLAPASARVATTRIEDSARAGLSTFGATVLLFESVLACQAFDVNGEPYHGWQFVLEDLGGNFCGCPEATAPCLVVSEALVPPPPVEPPEPPEIPAE